MMRRETASPSPGSGNPSETRRSGCAGYRCRCRPSGTHRAGLLTGVVASVFWLLPARAAAQTPPIIVSDTFTGSDGTLLTAHAPDINHASAGWTLNGGSPTPTLHTGWHRSGQAVGRKMRMRAAPSTTRAAILIRRRRKVANSANDSGERLGTALRMASMSR